MQKSVFIIAGLIIILLTASCQKSVGEATRIYNEKGETLKYTDTQTPPPAAKQTSPKTIDSAVKTDSAKSCTDTDGGKNNAVKGTITGTSGASRSYTAEDKCLSAATLNEFYCEGNSAREEIVNCLTAGYTTCTDGACK